MVNSELQRQNQRLTEQENEIRQQRQQLDVALNNMAHGLCIFDEEFRLLVCNARYVELMRLSPDLIKPGVTLREILQHNVDVGNLPAPAQAHYEGYLRELNQHGAVASERVLLDGRTMAIRHHPMPAGGWVATYEDSTERKETEAKILQLARTTSSPGWRTEEFSARK